MSGRSDRRREDFNREYEGGGVGSPVSKEEGKGVHSDESVDVGEEVVVVPSEEGHEDRHEEEAHHLNRPATHLLNGEHSEPVARNNGGERDDSLCASKEIGLVQRSHPAGLGVVGAHVLARCAVCLADNTCREKYIVQDVAGAAGLSVGSFDVIHGHLGPVDLNVRDPPDGGVDVGLEETLGVEGNVDKEPG